ncbi:MAG: TetR/AcrR family transcriptional regulator [Acidimicrobiales bacterium]
MARPTTTRRKPLDRATIVAAGVALADEAGAAGVTMRVLAERLGFKVMALYNHVANKDELLALMVDAVAAEIDEPTAQAEPLEAVRQLAIATRAAFVRHPWAAELWQRHLPGPARTDHMEHLLRILDQSGLSPEIAHHGFHAVNNHVLGYTLQEQALAFDTSKPGDLAGARDFIATMSSERHPHTIAHVNEHLRGNSGSSFELVLDLILDGLTRLESDC